MSGNKPKIVIGLVLAVGIVGLSIAAMAPSPAGAGEPVPPKAQAKQPASAAERGPGENPKEDSEQVTVAGIVVGPDGKPFVGAHVFLTAPWSFGPDLSHAVRTRPDAAVRTITDKNGAFTLTAKAADFGPDGRAELVATGTGAGLAWARVGPRGAGKLMTLRLVADDNPVEGRVVDLEGQPLAGISVHVQWVGQVADEGAVTAWAEKNKRGKFALNKRGEIDGLLEGVTRLDPSGLDVPSAVRTDKEGRFRLAGYGRGRALFLAVQGPTIAETRLTALTVSGPADGWSPSPYWGLYPARFEFVAAVGKPIVGKVRDKASGKPIAGITVAVQAPIRSHATTDAEGRFRITGALKSKTYTVTAGVPASEKAYFNHTKFDLPDTAGVEPFEVDFDLERGIQVRGRLTDRETGKPVRGTVHYYPLADNPNLKNYTTLGRPQQNSIYTSRTSRDGSFTVLAVPGTGVLAANADDPARFAPAEKKDWNIDSFGGGAAVVPINVSETDPKTAVCDIALYPGRNVTGSVLDPGGRPLSGAYVAGLRYGERFTLTPPKLDGATFTAAFDPRCAGSLVFVQPEKKLAAVCRLGRDEKGPLEVRLTALGTATGRVVDAAGKPRRDQGPRPFRAGRGRRQGRAGRDAVRLRRILAEATRT